MLNTLSGESEIPKVANIQLDYILRDGDRLKADEVAHAGYTYMNFLDEAERGNVEVREHETLTSVLIGRKVIKVMAFAELDHEADLMKQGIKGIATQLGLGEVIVRSFAGRQITGHLSEEE
jgi:hypothetical protein